MGTGCGTAGASCFSSTFLGRAIVAVVVWRFCRLIWLRAGLQRVGLQSGGFGGELGEGVCWCWRGGVVGQVQGAGCSWCGGGRGGVFGLML